MFVVTGGTSGIGRALALAIASRGETVVVIGRRLQELEKLQGASSKIYPLAADVGTEEGRGTIANFFKEVGTIKALVNNAGTMGPLTRLQETTTSAWQQTMAINVDAVFFLTQLLYQQLQQGRVLNVSSAVAHFPVAKMGAYCVSKAALSMQTRCWQLEATSLAFAAAAPGIVDTDMFTCLHSSDLPDAGWYQSLKESGRLVAPETAAQFLAWLLLDTADDLYASKEWDIYDTTHHHAWLKPPATVPPLQ